MREAIQSELDRAILETHRNMNPMQLEFYFTTLHISESENHVLHKFAIGQNNTALFSKAVLPSWLNFSNYGSLWETFQAHLHYFNECSDLKLYISHFVIKSESIFVIHKELDWNIWV